MTIFFRGHEKHRGRTSSFLGLGLLVSTTTAACNRSQSDELGSSPREFNHRFTASIETNASTGCSTLLDALLATACATHLAASFASPLEDRKHARMAKPALRCASLTLNAATCELNGYGKAAEILLALAEPHTQCHGCHPNLTISVLCFAVLRLLCFTCLCFPLLCHT